MMELISNIFPKISMMLGVCVGPACIRVPPYWPPCFLMCKAQRLLDLLAACKIQFHQDFHMLARVDRVSV